MRIWNAPTTLRSLILLGFLALSVATAQLRAEVAEERRLLQVRVDSQGHLQSLASLGVDIAGVNRAEGTATVVATAEERHRLEAAGFVVAREESRPASPEALSDYSDPAEISAFLDRVQAEHPNLARKVSLTGPLYEGQVVYAMHITKDVGRENDRPSFLLDAQHHAREVMTPEIALDALDYLTSRYATDSRVRRWVDSVNIWVVPSVNPDGAQYVHAQDIWWRKNRRPDCPVDLNRNYPFNWGACYGSAGTCSSEINRGPSPSSEPETAGLLALMDATRPIFNLSFHSSGEYILSPYGCYDPSEAELFLAIGEGLNAILENDDGQTGLFRTGPGWSTIYTTDGTSDDAAYGLFGALSWVIEVNREFQPDYARLRDVTVRRQRTAWQYFLDLTLDAPSIRGTVRDSSTGEPLRASIGVHEAPMIHGEAPRSTDAHGRYARLLEPGRSYTVTFEAEGYCAKTLSVSLGEGPATLDAELEPTLTAPPSGPAPPSGSINQPFQLTLSWEDLGPGPYQVYFGTTSEPPMLATVGSPSFTPPELAPGVTYFWRVAVDAGCGSVAGPVWSFTTYPHRIARVAKKGNPFRLVLDGEGFNGLCSVKVNGVAVPNTAFKSLSRLVAKGGSALKAMVPKGVPVTLTVEDSRGGSSPPYAFSW